VAYNSTIYHVFGLFYSFTSLPHVSSLSSSSGLHFGASDLFFRNSISVGVRSKSID
jgi:hypothetical protein